MNCREFVEVMLEYHDGELDAVRLASFEQHCEDCPPCLHYWQSYQRCIQMGKSACQCLEDEAPLELPESLIRSILAARRQ